MKYAYEDLNEDQFEKLVILVCQRLFGVAVQGFAKGPDGGRDAKFIGTAQSFPSTNSPWSGTTIIQAKHTNGVNRTFSDKEFFSPNSATCTIAEEIPRIKKLKNSGELDQYVIFSNRRLTGDGNEEIRSFISSECDIPIDSIYLCGTEQLELWLKQHSDIPELAALDPVDSPLIVSPDDLAEIVQALAKNKDKVSETLENPPEPRIPYAEKNEINNMTPEYAKLFRRRYLKESKAIGDFLAAPENDGIKRYYDDVVEEFEAKIIAKRRHYQSFDEVMEHLLDLLFARDPILRQQGHKRLTRSILFYMYWNCDIGLEEDAEAEQTL